MQGYIDSQTESDITTVCYYRVSGKSQTDDLKSQFEYMCGKFPTAEIIKDYGSGVNFKPKGLQTLLERVMRGDKFQIIVAHRDRLARCRSEHFAPVTGSSRTSRIGGEIIRFLVEQNGGEVMVLD